MTEMPVLVVRMPGGSGSEPLSEVMPRNPLHDIPAMNKTMEYMAFRLPMVALLDDEPRRTRPGKPDWKRVEQELAWCHQERTYLGVYDDLIGVGTAFERTGT